MRSLNLSVFAALLSFTSIVSAFGQEDFTSQEAEDFKVRMSLGIGVTGFASNTEYVMADDYEVGYDVMSLLKDRESRGRVGVSEEQFAALMDVRAESKTKMESMTLSAAYSEEGQDRLKALFFEAESEMRAMLKADQIAMLNLERVRDGIEMVGPSYLAEPDIASLLGIPSEASERIGKRRNQYVKQSKTTRLELLKAANQKLIESLNDSQQEELEKLFDKKTRKQFVEAELFVGGKVLRKKSQPWGERYRLALGLKSIQRKLDLSQDQLDRTNSLKENQSDLAETIAGILSAEQVLTLDQRGVRVGVRKLGTVNTMADGLIGQRLALSDAEKDRMFETGKQLQTDFHQQIERAAIDLAANEFGLDEAKASMISKLLR